MRVKEVVPDCQCGWLCCRLLRSSVGCIRHFRERSCLVFTAGAGEMDSERAANSVCSLPSPSRIYPTWATLKCRTRVNPSSCGGGLGRGVASLATLAPLMHDPHPQPLPTRGRGAHRVCCSFAVHWRSHFAARL